MTLKLYFAILNFALIVMFVTNMIHAAALYSSIFVLIPSNASPPPLMSTDESIPVVSLLFLTICMYANGLCIELVHILLHKWKDHFTDSMKK